MKKPFIEDFQIRKKEVLHYIAALNQMEKRLNSGPSGKPSNRQNMTLQTFRAGAILILYNTIEASMRDSVGAIYDELGSNQKIPFQLLREELKRRIIKGFKKHANADVHYNMNDIAVELILASFNEEKLFSGNVDAREIKSVSKELGFSTKTNSRVTQDGKDLVTIKRERNNLAHGIKAFSEVGKIYLTSDIRRLCKTSLAYLEEILDNIDSYIDNQEYLESVSSSTTSLPR